MDIKYKNKISLIIIFADNKFSQTNHEYYKILLTDDKKIISKDIGILHKNITDCLRELYNEYIKIDYDWPIKYLVNCRKDKNIIEITYICKLPMINDCYKAGKLININDFLNLKPDEYYVKIATSTSPESFR